MGPVHSVFGQSMFFSLSFIFITPLFRRGMKIQRVLQTLLFLVCRLPLVWRLNLTCVILDIYNQAFSTNLLQADVEQIVPVILARAGYEKRRMENDPDGGYIGCTF
jgi:hypothetical protein